MLSTIIPLMLSKGRMSHDSSYCVSIDCDKIIAGWIQFQNRELKMEEEERNKVTTISYIKKKAK